MPAQLAAVLCGGVVGTGLRMALEAVTPDGGTLSFATVAANVLGSFVLGALVACVFGRTGVPQWLRTGLSAGLLGSFTTFSALTTDAGEHLAAGRLLLACAELGVTVVLGLGAALAGLVLGGPGPSEEGAS